MAERVPARGDAGKRPPAPVHFAFPFDNLPAGCGERLRVASDLRRVTCPACIAQIQRTVAEFLQEPLGDDDTRGEVRP